MRHTHVPPQWGKQPLKVAFIGEAPSDEELDKGQPLVGPSGRIFNSMLRTAGLERSDFFIGNVFDEKLPGNDIKAWTVPLKEARALGLDKLGPIAGGFLTLPHHVHLDRLKEELTAAAPNLIVPLGGTALWAFTGVPNIQAVRGTILPATHVIPGAKLLPTFHPMAVMHQWKLYSVVVGDILKAVAEAENGPEITYPKRELFLEPTIQEIRDYIPRLRKSKLLSFDIETGWGQITCIGFAPDKEHAITIPFLDKRQPTRNYWGSLADEVEAWKLVREILSLPVPKLGQNAGAYDAFWLLKKKNIAPVNFMHDTRLLHHALYPELPKDLAFMGASYTTQGAWKHWGHAAQNTKRDD